MLRTAHFLKELQSQSLVTLESCWQNIWGFSYFHIDEIILRHCRKCWSTIYGLFRNHYQILVDLTCRLFTCRQSTNKNARNMCEICTKLTIKKPERRHSRCFDIFIVDFEQISHFALVLQLLNLNQ